MSTLIEDSALCRTRSQSRREASRQLAAEARRLVADSWALRSRLPRPITGGSGRSVIVGRIVALHDDYIELAGGIRIFTPPGMLTKGLIVGTSVAVTATRPNGVYFAERVELFKP